MGVIEDAENLLDDIENEVLNQQVLIKNKQILEESIERYLKEVDKNTKDLNILNNAIVILKEISDNSVKESYEFMESSINAALARIFPDKVRRIKFIPGNRGKYPTLEISLSVENGVTRSLVTGSGHGIGQVISQICILSVLVITGARRFAVFDEVMSGMSIETRRVFDSVLWAFAEIGFQYLIVEHGYIPKGAHVYELESKDGVGYIKKDYIEKYGVYLEGQRPKVTKEGKLEYGNSQYEEDSEELEEESGSV